jgi:outer membrane lipoprotein-sorting protein
VPVLSSRPALRWMLPLVAAVVVVGGGATIGTVVATADQSLAARSAAQLLADLQNVKAGGMSGTFVESADFGLPPAPGLADVAGPGISAIAGLLTGNSTARVWQAGPDRTRVALLTGQDETDLIRDGSDVWMWNSTDRKAGHFTIPPGRELPSLPRTPQQIADTALAAIDPTTRVETTGAAEVAGRHAYELVLSPADPASLIGQVRLAVDAETHVPLRVDVYALAATRPAVRVAFQQISFAVPDPGEFAFNPPPGTKVAETDVMDLFGQLEADFVGRPSVVGEGWTSMLEARLPPGADRRHVLKLARGLPRVTGRWGSGHLFTSPVLSLLITDDGRLLAGAVTPARLYAALQAD